MDLSHSDRIVTIAKAQDATAQARDANTEAPASARSEAANLPPIVERSADHAKRYGDQHFGIYLRHADRNAVIGVYGNAVTTTPDGALFVTGKGGAVNCVVAAGAWKAVFGLSPVDNLPAAVTQWRQW